MSVVKGSSVPDRKKASAFVYVICMAGLLSLKLVTFQGFLLLDSFFKPEELDPGKVAVNDLVDELANRLYEAGKIKSKRCSIEF
jgi:hypothetical protein